MRPKVLRVVGRPEGDDHQQGESGFPGAPDGPVPEGGPLGEVSGPHHSEEEIRPQDGSKEQGDEGDRYPRLVPDVAAARPDAEEDGEHSDRDQFVDQRGVEEVGAEPGLEQSELAQHHAEHGEGRDRERQGDEQRGEDRDPGIEQSDQPGPDEERDREDRDAEQHGDSSGGADLVRGDGEPGDHHDEERSEDLDARERRRQPPEPERGSEEGRAEEDPDGELADQRKLAELAHQFPDQDRAGEQQEQPDDEEGRWVHRSLPTVRTASTPAEPALAPGRRPASA